MSDDLRRRRNFTSTGTKTYWYKKEQESKRMSDGKEVKLRTKPPRNCQYLTWCNDCEEAVPHEEGSCAGCASLDLIYFVQESDHDRIVAQHEKQFVEYCDRVGDDIQHLNKTIAELRAEVECKRLAKDQAIAAHNKIVTEYNEQRENIIELIKKIADVKTERDELRAEVERLKHAIKQEIQNNDEFGCEFVYIVMAKETIARQARVIEIATRTMATVLEIEHCGETSCPRPMRAMCSNESHMVLRESLKTIAAIERAEAEGEKYGRD